MNLPHLLNRKTFNDTLALLLLGGIPGLWMFSAWVKALDSLVLGATILAWGNVVQHYFRKAGPNGELPEAPKPEG